MQSFLSAFGVQNAHHTTDTFMPWLDTPPSGVTARGTHEPTVRGKRTRSTPVEGRTSCASKRKGQARRILHHLALNAQLRHCGSPRGKSPEMRMFALRFQRHCEEVCAVNLAAQLQFV